MAPRSGGLPDLHLRIAKNHENRRVRRFGGGAACVTRTRDPIITNDVLYRLS
jgi:hypothetical protein